MQTVIFLAQLLGPVMVLVSLAMLLRAQSMINMMEVLLQNPPLLFVLGVGQLLGGVTIVLAHDSADGATLALVLVLLGWWLIARGVMLIFLSQNALWALIDSIELTKYHYLSNVVSFLIGGYLTWAGFPGLVSILHPISS